MFDRQKKQVPSQRARFEQEALIHLDALYTTAIRLTQDRRDAEDLVQDAVLQAYRAFDQYQPGTRCKAWLYKILTNTFINKYRRRVREHEVADEMVQRGDLGIISESLAESGRDVEETVHFARMSDSIVRALTALPEEFRLAVLLSDVEEFSYREIADIMDCPVGTVMSRLHRGRRLLQSTLREHAIRSGIIQAEPAAKSSEPGRVIPLTRRASSKN
ncbi:MAG: sigma-70 family RNA polymerase sigma factor [Myxococcales bacterium]|nr:sigma-70 family RNA polymerase sigma factor [Myxococcales bacterium]